MKIIRNRKGEANWTAIAFFLFATLVILVPMYFAYNVEKAKIASQSTSQPINVEKSK